MNGFRFIKDWQGMGLTYQVIAKEAYEGQDILIWAWSCAMDGPVDEEVEHLLNQMSNWSGGWVERK